MLHVNSHPRVTALVNDLLQKKRGDIEAIRNSNKRVSLQIVKNVVRPIVEGLKVGGYGRPDYNVIGKYNVSALWTVVSDLSVLFTTRDWGVTGTISTIPGALGTINDPHRRT